MYLAERNLTVEVVNWFPEFTSISCGFPLDSILGPLMFLIYENDMSQAAESEFYLYADQSCLLFQYKELIEIKK